VVGPLPYHVHWPCSVV